jgi:hypothetical protein
MVKTGDQQTTKKHCRKYGHIDGGSNEYRHVVIISYIFIIANMNMFFYSLYVVI